MTAPSARVRIAIPVALSCALAGCGSPLPPPPRPPALDRLDPLVASLVADTLAATPAGSSDAAARARLAMVYQANSMPALAEQAYLHAIETDGGHARWWYGLATTRAELGEFGSAIETMDRVLAIEPASAPAHRHRGFWLMELGRLDEARGAFDDALAVEPKDAGARVGLTRVHLLERRADAALAALEPLVQANPTSEYLRHLRGLALQQAQRYAEAGPLLAGRTGSVPRWPDPWSDDLATLRTGFPAILAEADTLVDQGRPDAAIVKLLELRRTFPDDPTLLAKLGEVHLGRGDHAKARTRLEEAIAAAPDAVAAHLHIARLFRETGDTERARHHAETALSIHPGFAPAYRELTSLELGRGDLDAAERAILRMLDAGAGDIAIAVDLGAIRYELGRRDDAAAALLGALSQDPLQDRALVLMARIEAERGRFDAAEVAVRRAAGIRGSQDPLIVETVRYLRELRSKTGR